MSQMPLWNRCSARMDPYDNQVISVVSTNSLSETEVVIASDGHSNPAIVVWDRSPHLIHGNGHEVWIYENPKHCGSFDEATRIRNRRHDVINLCAWNNDHHKKTVPEEDCASNWAIYDHDEIREPKRKMFTAKKRKSFLELVFEKKRKSGIRFEKGEW